MSRPRHLQQLERQIEAARKAIDDLTRENYELKKFASEVIAQSRNQERKAA